MQAPLASFGDRLRQASIDVDRWWKLRLGIMVEVAVLATDTAMSGLRGQKSGHFRCLIDTKVLFLLIIFRP